MKTSNQFKSALVRVGMVAAGIIAFSNVSAQSQKLYFSMNDFGPKTQAFLKDNNIDNLVSLDNRYIDPGNKTLRLNPQVLTDAINKLIPDPSASGIANLDWEGKLYNDIRGKAPGSPEFNTAMGEFIKTVQLAKRLRPNIKWGFYGIPFTIHQYDEARLTSINNNIKPLLQECDVFMPELYLNGHETSGANAFAAQSMKVSLRLADQMNKPVLPFVWHRVDNGNADDGFKLIPLNDFNSFVATTVNTSYNGRKAIGVIWWGADTYYYKVAKDKALIGETDDQSYKGHYDDLNVQYGSKLLQTVKKN
jgi:hypothetical protein